MTLELTDREAGIAAYALYRFARDARLTANALAQRKEGHLDTVEAFFRDAEEAEALLTKLRASK